MSAHACAAAGCPRRCAADRVMCIRHWQMVPRDRQHAIWSAHAAGGAGSAEFKAAVEVARAVVVAFEAALPKPKEIT